MKKPIVSSSYKLLVKKITNEISDLESFIKRRTAQGYWRIGKFIHEHLLEFKDRADYGATLMVSLSKDVDRDRTTLQRSLQFYRIYPIRADQHKLTWDHYKRLITVKDHQERKRIEEQAIRHDWSTTKLGEYLHTKREFAGLDSGGKPVPQLDLKRGLLNMYPIAAANKSLIKKSPLVLDLGFRQQYLIPGKEKTAGRLKEGDCVELVIEKNEVIGVAKKDVAKDEIFTYQSKLDKVIDGDTLLVSFDFHLDVSISQKLRLKGIDCPEMDTEEGKRAKRFVESRLKDCEFIIVKTIKDRSDKFDRYLADVFYLPGEVDPHHVAQSGNYLNQELLDHRLAVVWK